MAALTRDFTNWVWIFDWVPALKFFVSTSRLRDMVPFRHLLVAFDNDDTHYKFGLRKPKRWGPRGEKTISGYLSRTRRTRDFTNWVWIFYWVSALKIFVSTPNLRNMVPFLHLLADIEN